MTNQTLTAESRKSAAAKVDTPVRVTRPEESLSVRSIALGGRGWLVPLALIALAGILFVVNQRHDAAASDSEEARKVVAAHVEQLLSYDHRTIEDDLAREKDWLTGSFADDYVSLVTGEIAPAAARVKVVTDARVSASGVTSTGNGEVELLLFVTITTRSEELDTPRVSGSRLAVTAELVDGEWRISALDPV
jgi:Mce-associated membrane protein